MDTPYLREICGLKARGYNEITESKYFDEIAYDFLNYMYYSFYFLERIKGNIINEVQTYSESDRDLIEYKKELAMYDKRGITNTLMVSYTMGYCIIQNIGRLFADGFNIFDVKDFLSAMTSDKTKLRNILDISIKKAISHFEKTQSYSDIRGVKRTLEKKIFEKKVNFVSNIFGFSRGESEGKSRLDFVRFVISRDFIENCFIESAYEESFSLDLEGEKISAKVLNKKYLDVGLSIAKNRFDMLRSFLYDYNVVKFKMAGGAIFDRMLGLIGVSDIDFNFIFSDAMINRSSKPDVDSEVRGWGRFIESNIIEIIKNGIFMNEDVDSKKIMKIIERSIQSYTKDMGLFSSNIQDICKKLREKKIITKIDVRDERTVAFIENKGVREAIYEDIVNRIGLMPRAKPKMEEDFDGIILSFRILTNNQIDSLLTKRSINIGYEESYLEAWIDSILERKRLLFYISRFVSHFSFVKLISDFVNIKGIRFIESKKDFGDVYEDIVRRGVLKVRRTIRSKLLVSLYVGYQKKLEVKTSDKFLSNEKIIGDYINAISISIDSFLKKMKYTSRVPYSLRRMDDSLRHAIAKKYVTNYIVEKCATDNEFPTGKADISVTKYLLFDNLDFYDLFEYTKDAVDSFKKNIRRGYYSDSEESMRSKGVIYGYVSNSVLGYYSLDDSSKEMEEGGEEGDVDEVKGEEGFISRLSRLIGQPTAGVGKGKGKGKGKQDKVEVPAVVFNEKEVVMSRTFDLSREETAIVGVSSVLKEGIDEEWVSPMDIFYPFMYVRTYDSMGDGGEKFFYIRVFSEKKYEEKTKIGRFRIENVTIEDDSGEDTYSSLLVPIFRIKQSTRAERIRLREEKRQREQRQREERRRLERKKRVESGVLSEEEIKREMEIQKDIEERKEKEESKKAEVERKKVERLKKLSSTIINIGGFHTEIIISNYEYVPSENRMRIYGFIIENSEIYAGHIDISIRTRSVLPIIKDKIRSIVDDVYSIYDLTSGDENNHSALSCSLGSIYKVFGDLIYNDFYMKRIQKEGSRFLLRGSDDVKRRRAFHLSLPSLREIIDSKIDETIDFVRRREYVRIVANIKSFLEKISDIYSYDAEDIYGYGVYTISDITSESRKGKFIRYVLEKMKSEGLKGRLIVSKEMEEIIKKMEEEEKSLFGGPYMKEIAKKLIFAANTGIIKGYSERKIFEDRPDLNLYLSGIISNLNEVFFLAINIARTETLKDIDRKIEMLASKRRGIEVQLAKEAYDLELEFATDLADTDKSSDIVIAISEKEGEEEGDIATLAEKLLKGERVDLPISFKKRARLALDSFRKLILCKVVHSYAGFMELKRMEEDLGYLFMFSDANSNFVNVNSNKTYKIFSYLNNLSCEFMLRILFSIASKTVYEDLDDEEVKKRAKREKAIIENLLYIEFRNFIRICSTSNNGLRSAILYLASKINKEIYIYTNVSAEYIKSSMKIGRGVLQRVIQEKGFSSIREADNFLKGEVLRRIQAFVDGDVNWNYLGENRRSKDIPYSDRVIVNLAESIVRGLTGIGKNRTIKSEDQYENVLKYYYKRVYGENLVSSFVKPIVRRDKGKYLESPFSVEMESFIFDYRRLADMMPDMIITPRDVSEEFLSDYRRMGVYIEWTNSVNRLAEGASDVSKEKKMSVIEFISKYLFRYTKVETYNEEREEMIIFGSRRDEKLFGLFVALKSAFSEIVSNLQSKGIEINSVFDILNSEYKDAFMNVYKRAIVNNLFSNTMLYRPGSYVANFDSIIWVVKGMEKRRKEGLGLADLYLPIYGL